MKETISILLETYNNSTTIERALDSIFSQDYEQLELIVADRGSIDDTLAIIQKYQQSYPNISLHTIASEMNFIELNHFFVERSQGEYLFWMDGRDFFLNASSLSKVYQLLIDSDADMAFGPMVDFNPVRKAFAVWDDDIKRVAEINFINIHHLMSNRYEFRFLLGKIAKRSLFEDNTIDLTSAQRMLYSLATSDYRILYYRTINYYSYQLDSDRTIPTYEKLLSRHTYPYVRYLVENGKSSEYDHDRITVAFCVDNNYAKYVGTLAYSIDLTTNKPVDIFIVYKYLSVGLLDYFEKLNGIFQNVRLCPRKLSNEELLLLDKVKGGYDKLPIEAYFRILLPALFPKLNRIIYMDVDILVNQSLAELWDQDLDGKFIGAVRDVGMSEEHNSWGRQFLLDDVKNYINSGMLILDLELIRKYKVISEFIEFISKYYGNFVLGDQDAFNLFFLGAIKLLPLKYNYIVHNFSLISAPIQEQVLIHYCGFSDPKPWKNRPSLPLEQREAVAYYRNTENLLAAKLSKIRVSLVLWIRGNQDVLRSLEALAMQMHLHKEILVLVDISEPTNMNALEDYIRDYNYISLHQGEFSQVDDVLSFVMKHANGDFVYLIKNSDSLECDEVISKLKDVQTLKDSDLVIGATSYVDNNGIALLFDPINFVVKDIKKELVDKTITFNVRNVYGNVLCGKLFKKQFLEKLIVENTSDIKNRIYLLAGEIENPLYVQQVGYIEGIAN